MSKLHALALAAATLACSAAANAYQTFSGIDNNGNPNLQVAPTNSSAASTAFLANLVGVGTENFENQTGSSPLELSFGAAGTATLSGGGAVATNPGGGTNGNGRYSVPGGVKYWETRAGTGDFSISFSKDLAAFGFFGIDIGDFAGTLQLQLLNAGDQVVGLLDVPSAASNVADGSILYFGLLAANAGEQFRKINFLTTTGTGDVFAFDSFTIGTQEQVQQPVPEPGTLALLCAALLGGALVRRRRG